MFLRSKEFWMGFVITLVLAGGLFAWELDLLPLLPQLVRPEPTAMDIAATTMIGLLLSLNAGLFLWRRKNGSCPRGVRRSSGIAGIIGAVTLLCPVCLALPIGIAGLGTILTLASAFLPILRLIAIVLLGTAAWLLWPK